jgi:hypothetical protein
VLIGCEGSAATFQIMMIFRTVQMKRIEDFSLIQKGFDGSGSFYQKIISPIFLTERLLTETSFDRTPFDQIPFDRKVILPKSHLNKLSFSKSMNL